METQEIQKEFPKHNFFVFVSLVLLFIALAEAYFLFDLKLIQEKNDIGNIGSEIANTEQDDPDLNKLEFCFYEYELKPSDGPRDNWVLSEFRGLALNHPDYVKIENTEKNSNSDNLNEDNLLSFKLVDTKNNFSADLYVNYLKENGLQTGSKYYKEPLYYETISNTWWHLSGGIMLTPLSKATQCEPNEVDKTNSGFPIYRTSSGDAGSFDVAYYIIMRDILPDPANTSGNYRPLSVVIRYSGDVNDSDLNKRIEAFKPILEGIIKTIDIRPIFKG